MSQNMTNVTNGLYKEEEFEIFLKLIEEDKFDTWELVADTLGVHKNTIQKWKEHPRAKIALANGLQNAVRQMESVGKRDWRMWREKVSLLRRENEKKEEELNTVTNNLIIIGEDQLAKYLYGFVSKLSGKGSALPEDSQTGESNAAGGEGNAVGQDSA